MCHRVARGIVPCVRLAASGSCSRADIRLRANVRPHTFAPASVPMVRVHPFVEFVLLHPVRHSHTQP
ncbi:hypothetical protein [Burkholderia sp. Ac-20345]|uniref:hypothetical protein n=1 Tax=Burkholderia sp. Ac-20345 TaxID=2703891 RepID=UPI00197B2F45|nr:hypothetical protein [Burkholderia sp. Ac-20345]